ncbi:Ger(x)C family spore germination protein [Cohnella sp. 56]|uniref:Ger(x)C family spore germination protein n=1 Tax=Cohnella sp. 56 TaxID=3113722 RepID=UPI0030EA87BF
MRLSSKWGRWLAVLCLLVPTALLQGCWDIRDIDNRMLVGAMGIARDDERGVTIWVRFPIPHAQQGTTSNDKGFLAASQRGKTVVDALDRLRARMPKYLDLSQTRAVFVDKKLAEEKGIYSFLDFAVRDRILPISAVFALIEGDMDPIFTRPNPSGELSGVYTRLFFEKYAGGTPQKNKVTLWQVFNKHYNPLQQNFVPLIAADDTFQFYLKGNMYFSGDRAAGTLTPDESLIYELVTGKLSPFEIETAGGANVKVETSSARIRTAWAEGRPDIDIVIRVVMKLMDASHTKPMNKQNIEQTIDRLLEDRAAKVFSVTQARESDIFGFGNRFRASLPTARHKEWPALYRQAKISVKLESHMVNEGLKLLRQ